LRRRIKMTISIYDNRLVGTDGYKPVATITWTFTTDAAGDVAEQTSVVINGQIGRVVTNPDNVDTPTTLWDLIVEDEDGADALCSDGEDRDAGDSGASEQVFPCACLLIQSKLTFTVANGGNTKKGIVKVYYT